MDKERQKSALSEINSVRTRARQLFNYWQVERRLNLSGKDSDLALDYVIDRLLRTRRYEATSILTSPLAAAARFLGGTKSAERLTRQREAAVDYLHESIASKIEAHFNSPEARTRARTIELAINTLVAEATPPSQTENMVENMQLSNDQLSAWTARWRPQLPTQAA